MKPLLQYLSKAPCSTQTQEDICTYYKSAQVGDLMCIRNTQHQIITYRFFRIDRISRGRIYPPSASGESSFWAKSGANCFHPHGQTTLVVPTVAITEAADQYEMRSSGVSAVQLTTDEARALLGGQAAA